MWVCSDSVNGYICSFKIYTGKDSTGSPHSNGLGYAVVTSLVEKYENKAILCIQIIFILVHNYVKIFLQRDSIALVQLEQIGRTFQ